MKVLCVLAALIALSIAASEQQLWASFKHTHAKQYKGIVEEKLRYQIFQDNLKKIEAHNALHAAGKVNYTMGVNQFADMTHEEFLSYLNTHPKPTRTGGLPYKNSNVAAEPTRDWRSFGAVTNVKDQGQCGSCWSFSTTASLEGAFELATGQLISLSEQALVDCNTQNAGCGGGAMQYAFDFVRDNGLPTEDDYPYQAIDGVCHGFNSAIPRISGYVDIPAHDEGSLLEAVSNVGPISVAVDASGYQFYSGGVFYDDGCSENSLNHGVAIVGYDNENGVDYWIVKNSWGTAWGEGGYIRMIRGINQCGITTDACYPVL